MPEALGTALGRIAASADAGPRRGLKLLLALRSAVPFDAAWLGFAGPRGGRYQSLASLDLDDDILEFFSGPAMSHDEAASGSDLDLLPVSRSDPSRPAGPLATWSDSLTLAGFQESLSVALFARGGRRVGFLVLLFRSMSPPSRTTRRRLAELAPVLTLCIDPMPRLLATARVVQGVTAGIVLCGDGSAQALPGLAGDPLLAIGSPVLAIACRRLGDGLLSSSFLWPLGGSFAPDGHARITVVAAPVDAPAVMIGVVLMSPVPDLKGLTPRELEVLGLVIEGCSNQEIAHALVVAPRTVAAHMEHLLVKLDVNTRTTAAVRAERQGLYVPSIMACLRGEPGRGECER